MQDAYTIHLRLVRFQILDRRAFDVDVYLDQAALPEANAFGWKDTVKTYPKTVTRITVPRNRQIGPRHHSSANEGHPFIARMAKRASL